MFLKSKSHDQSPKAQSWGLHGTESPSTVICADTKIGGNLTGVGAAHIDGEIGGDVYGRRVSVGEDGIVGGDINAEFVAVAGTVHGRIEALAVTLAATAVIGGTITHNELEIEQGATIGDLRPWRPPSFFEKIRKW
jgi:cytoskeletal protein CcmA (bactofilin family)